jgi:hypothetical protein
MIASSHHRIPNAQLVDSTLSCPTRYALYNPAVHREALVLLHSHSPAAHWILGFHFFLSQAMMSLKRPAKAFGHLHRAVPRLLGDSCIQLGVPSAASTERNMGVRIDRRAIGPLRHYTADGTRPVVGCHDVIHRNRFTRNFSSLAETFKEADYHRCADESLEFLQDSLAELENSDIYDADITLSVSQGGG